MTLLIFPGRLYTSPPVYLCVFLRGTDTALITLSLTLGFLRVAVELMNHYTPSQL